MDGKVVHELALPLSRIWDNPKRQPRPDPFVAWEYAHLYPNGDLLAMYIGMGDTPWGYGLVKMDKNSKLIWKYWDNVHHHLDVADDGKIYVLTNAIHNNPIEGYEQLKPPRIDDYVTVLSPDGKVLKRVAILDTLLRSPYRRIMRTTPWNLEADFLHTNSIEVISRAAAARLPFPKAGQILLSFRNINTIAVLDLSKQAIVWALQVSWRGQHDVDMLPNGDILMFDNYGHYETGGVSRDFEFNPVTLKRV